MHSKDTFDLNWKANGTNSGMNSEPEGTCRLSVAKGFILTLFFIILAVLVGLIVHFAGNGKETVCRCDCGAGILVPGTSSPISQLTTMEPVMERCAAWAQIGNPRICMFNLL